MVGRALGIDYGQKRIGVAVSDALGIAATPVEVIQLPTPAAAADRVAELARDREAEVLVFGLPFNMDGSDHPSAHRVQAFAGLCAERTGLPVEYVDERLTTKQAERHLWAAGQTRKGRKGKVDKVAAALLLQNWLDSRR
jgi:putative Holliday junction resolvase